jgi:hypothetical protein
MTGKKGRSGRQRNKPAPFSVVPRKRHPFARMAPGNQRANSLAALSSMIEHIEGWDDDMEHWLRAARDACEKDDVDGVVHYLIGAMAAYECSYTEEQFAANKRKGRRGID